MLHRMLLDESVTIFRYFAENSPKANLFLLREIVSYRDFITCENLLRFIIDVN